jgi:hypothetical protein
MLLGVLNLCDDEKEELEEKEKENPEKQQQRERLRAKVKSVSKVNSNLLLDLLYCLLMIN